MQRRLNSPRTVVSTLDAVRAPSSMRYKSVCDRAESGDRARPAEGMKHVMRVQVRDQVEQDKSQDKSQDMGERQRHRHL